MQVGILRITHGHGVLVGGTRLRHRDATQLEVQPRRAGQTGRLPRAGAT